VKYCSVEDFKQHHSLRGAAIGDPIELDSSGCRENDQMRAGPPKSQWRG
jgi:hypothetical protein